MVTSKIIIRKKRAYRIKIFNDMVDVVKSKLTDLDNFLTNYSDVLKHNVVYTTACEFDDSEENIETVEETIFVDDIMTEIITDSKDLNKAVEDFMKIILT